jgi:hypothetical protein
MPVVFRSDGYKFLFYSNEGDPREALHIHVTKGRDKAKFWLKPVALAVNQGFDARSLRTLERLVEQHSMLIERAWNEHFG